MGEKGDLTGGTVAGTEQGKLPSLPKFGAGPAAEAGWDKGPDGSPQIGRSVLPPQGPPTSAPSIGGFVAGRHGRDDDEQQPPPPPPGGSYPPPAR